MNIHQSAHVSTQIVPVSMRPNYKCCYRRKPRAPANYIVRFAYIAPLPMFACICLLLSGGVRLTLDVHLLFGLLVGVLHEVLVHLAAVFVIPEPCKLESVV